MPKNINQDKVINMLCGLADAHEALTNAYNNLAMTLQVDGESSRSDVAKGVEAGVAKEKAKTEKLLAEDKAKAAAEEEDDVEDDDVETEEEIAAAKKKAAAARRRKTAAAKKKAAEEAAAEDDDDDDDDDSAVEITLAMAQAKATDFVDALGVPGARKILENFGVKRVGQAAKDPKKLAEIYAAFKEALDDGVI